MGLPAGAFSKVGDDPNGAFLIRELAKAGWKVEVYGPGWERDPVVCPFHKGIIRPGPELAALYQRMSHALCSAPNILNHLPVAHFNHKKFPATSCEFPQFPRGKRP